MELAEHWKDDQHYLQNAIGDYRKLISGKELRVARSLTKEFAEEVNI